jgi:hypothetical protein
MTFKVIEIRDSELSYKNKIPNKEYKGFKQGLCHGWQFEIRKSDGTIVYSDVSYDETHPDMYPNDYMDFLREHFTWTFGECVLTGRVVFRGYGKSVYIPEERDYGVIMVEDI